MIYDPNSNIFGDNAEWTKISINLPKDMSFFKCVERLNTWCKENESNDRYYYIIGITNITWWFEDDKDATIFSLIWSKVIND